MPNKLFFKMTLFIFSMNILIGCEPKKLEKETVKYVFSFGSKVIEFGVDSLFKATDCGNNVFDDSFCKGFESDKYKIICNYSKLPRIYIEKLESSSIDQIESQIKISMIDRVRQEFPNCIISTPKNIQTKNNINGIFLAYTNASFKSIRFSGFGINQNLLLNVLVESKSMKETPEIILIDFIEKIQVTPPQKTGQ